MRRGLGEIKGELNNFEFSYKFPESSKGGAGSNGNGWSGGLRGGKVFIPDDEHGGGGGSGADHYSGHPPKDYHGIDAISYRGAEGPRSGVRVGGDGGKLKPDSNGGLLYIKANKII